MQNNGPTPSQCLTWGILGLALSETGIIGLIFSIIAKNKIKAYNASGQAPSGQVNTGSRLATAGLIVSIVFIVIWVIYIIAISAAVANGLR